MHISNIRLGFATNSSSSHSIIFNLPEGDFQIDDNNFGWDEFCAASAEAKGMYLAQTLYSNISMLIGEDMAKAVCSDWCKSSANSDGYVDHQSLMSLPVSRKLPGWGDDGVLPIDKEFFDELKQYYMRPNLVIVGGNDNGEHERYTEGRQDHILPTDHGSGVYVCRRDGHWWTLMNRFTGAKIRLSFQENPPPFVKAKSPELVDIKITNFCPFGCDYCYQDSTLEGKHADWDFLQNLVRALEEQEVFEVAIGGGEPTMYPKFAELLATCKRGGIIPNFTTRNLAWLKDEAIREAVKQTSGRFAYSVDRSMDMYRIYMAVESAGLLTHNRGEKRLSFQYVMGSGDESAFKEVLKTSGKLGCDLTLLGFKEVGRGKGYQYWDYKKTWLSVLQGFRQTEYIPRVGIDTALANESRADLETGRFAPLVTFDEGAFSMYVDAVDRKMGPSSFCSTDEYLPFTSNEGHLGCHSQDIEKQIKKAFKGFKASSKALS